MTSITRKKTTLALGVILFTLAAIVAAVPRVIDLNRYNARIVSNIETALGGKAHLGRITWSLYRGLRLAADGFSLKDGTGIIEEARIKGVYADVSLFALLSRKIVIKNLHLDTPKMSIKLTAGGPKSNGATLGQVSSRQDREARFASDDPNRPNPLSIDENTPSQHPTPDKSPTLKFILAGITVNQGHVTVKDALTLRPQIIEHRLNEVAVKAYFSRADRTLAFELSFQDAAENGFGSLAARGTLFGLTEKYTIENPQLTVKAALKDLHAASIKPYLKNNHLTDSLDGSVSAEIDYQGNLGRTGQASGAIDLGHLSYSNRSLQNDSFPGAASRLLFGVSFTPEELVADRVALTIGQIALDGRSRLKNWTTTPVLENVQLSGDIPLADLKSLVPWVRVGKNTELLQDIMAGGGKISIDHAGLKHLDLAKPPAELASLWTQVELAGTISGVSVHPTPKLPMVPRSENISSAFRLTQGVLEADNLTGEMAAVSLPEISGRITRLTDQPLIVVRLKGPIKITEAIDDSVNALWNRLGFEKLALDGVVDLTVEVDTAQSGKFGILGTAQLRDSLLKTSFSPAVFQGLSADVALAVDTATVSSLATTVLLPTGKGSSEKQARLTVDGTLSDWRHHPVLNLKNLKTSPVPLSALAAAIPWQRFKKPPLIVEESFQAGGTVEIDHLSLPPIDLSEPLKDPASLLSAANGSIRLEGVSVRPGASFPLIEDITGQPKLENGVLTSKDTVARIGPLTTPTMTIEVTNLTSQPKFRIMAKGPMRVTGTKDETVERLLQDYGLESLSGKAEVDVAASYDSAAPGRWSASGTAILDGVKAAAYPSDARMDNLRGRLSFSKREALELTFENLTGEFNAAPIRLNGKISGGSPADLSVDLQTEARRLDLAVVSKVVPGMRGFGLQGKIDLNMDIFLPHDKPLESRLTGTLKTDQFGLHLKEAAFKVDNADADVEFSGRSAAIKRLTMSLNDQTVDVTGQLSRPENPALEIVVSSPDLDIDRLMFTKKLEEKLPDATQAPPLVYAAEESQQKKTAETEWPRFLHLSAATVRLEAQKGRFRGQEVKDLRITADYDEGVIKNYTVDFTKDGGQATATGMIDLRTPGQTDFRLDPAINAVPLETIAALIGVEKYSEFGPVSINGRLKGRMGVDVDPLSSLTGHLEAEMGYGRLKNVGPTGAAVVKMLSLLRVENLLRGNLTRKLKDEGVKFDSIKTEGTFDEGKLLIHNYTYKSTAFNLTGNGTIDFVKQKVDARTQMELFDTVGKLLSHVPIVGGAAKKVINLHFAIHGPLDDPIVRLAPAEGLIRSLEESFSAPRKILNDGREPKMQ